MKVFIVNYSEQFCGDDATKDNYVVGVFTTERKAKKAYKLAIKNACRICCVFEEDKERVHINKHAKSFIVFGYSMIASGDIHEVETDKILIHLSENEED